MALFTALLCSVYTSVLYPPLNLQIQGNNILSYNIDRASCPPINADTEVQFQLYTRNNPNNPDLLKTDNDALLAASQIDFNKTTKIFFHGFLESYTNLDAQSVKNATLQTEDANVILVNALLLLAGPNYNTAVDNVVPIGKFAAKFIDYLVSKGLDLDKFEVVGHSLGGQIAGIVGGNVQSGQIKKIMAYDPAGPGFTSANTSMRLDASDALQVIVIHTSPGIFGYPDSCGTIDFWVNGKPLIQPGCSAINQTVVNLLEPTKVVFCSHHESYQVGVYSMNHPEAFPGRKCASMADYTSGACNNADLQYINDNVPINATGDYIVPITASMYFNYGLANI